MLAMPTLALLCDFPEENWPSMRVVADGLDGGLKLLDPQIIQGKKVCAIYRHRSARLWRHGAARNADRLWNRFVVYPKFARTLSDQFDFFHVTDHSYAQLVHVLPAERTGVYCHDLDTFRCLLEPVKEPRPRWFKAMTRRVLRGMQEAAVVFHSTDVVREQIVRHGIIDPAKLVKSPYGVSDFFRPAGFSVENDPDLPHFVPRDRPFLLHVGSCIARKRVDVLLDVFAELSQTRTDLLLVKIGGEWTSTQLQQIERLGIGEKIRHSDDVERREIAACYRHAAAALMTSEAEGFGLPVAEGLSCGAIVICSDIPVFREVGGDAALYARLADVPDWTRVINNVIVDSTAAPSREKRLARAMAFSWRQHASIIAGKYQSMLRS